MTPQVIQHGQLEALEIRSADGASAIISLYGAHLISWKTADGRERLFCSALAKLDGSKPIRGGVPVIFPQFSEQGTGQRHGFARTTMWAAEESGIDEQGAAYGEFVLNHDMLPPELAKQWPCRLRLRVKLQAQQLEIQLQVDNLGAQALQFASALHSYFAIDDIAQCEVVGLQDLPYTELGVPGTQGAGNIRFDGKMDRLFLNIPRPLQIIDGQHCLDMQQSGFSDVAVWNPGPDDARALADMEDEEYRRFVCVEVAQVTRHTLEAGQSWLGTHQLRASVAV